MKPLFTEEEIEKAKLTDKLPCECYHCKNTFYRKKNELLSGYRPNKFCSLKCVGLSNKNKHNKPNNKQVIETNFSKNFG